MPFWSENICHIHFKSSTLAVDILDTDLPFGYRLSYLHRMLSRSDENIPVFKSFIVKVDVISLLYYDSALLLSHGKFRLLLVWLHTKPSHPVPFPQTKQEPKQISAPLGWKSLKSEHQNFLLMINIFKSLFCPIVFHCLAEVADRVLLGHRKLCPSCRHPLEPKTWYSLVSVV